MLKTCCWLRLHVRLGNQGACRPLDPLLDAPRLLALRLLGAPRLLYAAACFVFTRGRAAPWTPCSTRRA